jgi:hypothetical protein
MVSLHIPGAHRNNEGNRSRIGLIIKSREKIEKLRYNLGYQKIGDEFFIGGAF